MKQHWLLITLLLLAACSTGPRPGTLGVDGGAGLLGVAEVGSEGVSVQALVPGLSFSVCRVLLSIATASASKKLPTRLTTPHHGT